MTRRDDISERASSGRRLLLALALVWLLWPAAEAAAQPAGCDSTLASEDLIDHAGSSSCVLCGEGTVTIEIENPTNGRNATDFTDLIVREDLRSSGLVYVAGSTRLRGQNISVPSDFEPNFLDARGSELEWRFENARSVTLPTRPGGPGSTARLFIDFRVEYYRGDRAEELVDTNRDIQAEVDLFPTCSLGGRLQDSTGVEELDLEEPRPRVIKRGRNLDAGQGGYSDPVYAHENDDIIWRIDIQNQGDADLFDVRFDDTMTPDNFLITHICDSQNGAINASGGGSPSSCYEFPSPVTSINDFDLRGVFGGPGSYVVAPAGGRGRYYLVGDVISSCDDRNNLVDDVEWGCESQSPPVGGIDETSNNQTAQDTARLRTISSENGVNVSVALSGINDPNQPMGARGLVTITIDNRSGGTIRGEAAGLRMRNLLPQQYVIDPTFTPTIDMDPAYGSSYPGMVEFVQWTNPVPGTFPIDPDDATTYLNNRDIELMLTSDGAHPNFSDQEHMIRHGDVVTVQFRTVLIDPTFYDKVANLDVRTEAPGSDPANTDPIESFTISNELDVWFEEFCDANGVDVHLVEVDTTEDAIPEDIDVQIIGNELIFILTATGDPLPLAVELTNDGGHDADDYFAYVAFGEGMIVQDAPTSCTSPPNPPIMPEWTLPAEIPAGATLYVCDPGIIGPNSTVRLDFNVVKNPSLTALDDLTFRADVIGEITLSDTTPLWFPAPTARTDGELDRANDYTLDGLRARVVGYDLLKTQMGLCTENPPPPGNPDPEVQIGEECTFHVESGGWFGFQTPGFTYIAVQRIQVTDQLPDGQGYISSTNPLLTSTDAIKGVTLNPPPSPNPLAEAPFDWTFNFVVPGERITEKDHWFRTNVVTRLLNDPPDSSAAPNIHEALSRNVLTSTFQAVFFNSVTNMEEVFDLGPQTIGYPREVHRRVDLTVTEPQLTVTKTVCNETLNGVGPSCSPFLPLVDDGDAYDSYIYRIRVENLDDGAVTRAPAYDVTVTNITDISDQLYVDPLQTDGFDNDADSLIDTPNDGNEGTIGNNVPEDNIPARVVAAYTHSSALRQIDAGQYVDLYYRVDPDDDVAPLQQLTSRAYATYDSLAGPSGSQSDPLGLNGESGGARQYQSAESEATIQIIPVETTPKLITRVANSTLVAAVNPQPVSIGEEIEFQLQTLIPVARLRSFVIRDVLPEGLSCVEAPEIDLGPTGPYAAAGFVPGGSFTPTCTDTEVVWDFQDQTVTSSPRDDRRFDFAIRFIARVDNIDSNRDTLEIVNGGTATETTVNYINEDDEPVVVPIDEASMVVLEPSITLTKDFFTTVVDGDDVVRVTVTATNDGTAAAYNLRVLDDLTTAGLSYVGNVSGSDPPSVVDLSLFGPDSPVFSWGPGSSLAPGASLSFWFEVRVDSLTQPLTVHENTIQADWTSLPGRTTALNTSGQMGEDGSPTGMRIGALPNAADPINDYEAEASDSMSVPPILLEKVDLDPSVAPEIGARKYFQVEIRLPEGSTQNLVVSDDLASGSVSYALVDNINNDVTYQFIGIASINGQAPTEAALNAVPYGGTTGTAVWNLGTVVTDTEDDISTQLVSPTIRIRYYARLVNDLATNAGSTLRNGVTVSYTNGETGELELVSDGTPTIVATEPLLTATKVLTNVTPGKGPADPPAFGDILQYVVRILNGGDAIAHDVNIVDTLPPELTLYGGFSPTATINTTPVGFFAPAPAGRPSGPLIWGRGNGDGNLDIPIGGFLELTYQIEVTTPLISAQVLENRVWTDWTSLEGGDGFERDGAGCPNISPPDDYCFGPAVASEIGEPIANAPALAKANTQTTASIGEAFRYRITVPQTPYAFPIYDVRIQDDLSTSAAALRFVRVDKVSTPGSWIPVNTGSATNLVIEDVASGIDIPAGQQIVVDVTVVLEDAGQNTTGLPFSNTAWYLYNWVDGDDTSQLSGDSGTSPPMTIVTPDELNVTKTGPPTLTVGIPATFTLNVHNPSTGPAWNVTLLDRLSNTPAGGTCDLPPSNITAQVFEVDGTTDVSGVLVEDTDYRVDFAGDPTCELTLTMLSGDAVVGADQRLIVSYDVLLDVDSSDGASLTNVAGATEWWSADGTNPDTVGDRRPYAEIVDTGSVGILDHEDAHTATTSMPLHSFSKRVINLTRNTDPGSLATPGDRLQYVLRIDNLGTTPMPSFDLRDELDRLNAIPAFAPDTLQITNAPATADVSNTDPAGGASGTGLLDIRGLSLPNQGDFVEIVFEVNLAPVITNGTVVSNQSQLLVSGGAFSNSDDPNLNGAADPVIVGDEDPTTTTIESAPLFQIQKVSSDLTGDPAILLAGESLRYTITVKNIGTEDADDAMIRDNVPVNTQYVAGSTTFNGAAIADGPGGVAPLSLGLSLNAPENPTPGAMRADVSATADNVATLSFDVVVDPSLIDGTILSNQAFVSALNGGVSDQPSDDPQTATPNDPTRDVVGNTPLLFATKDVALYIDTANNNLVDPGDTLRYTISVINNGAIPATGATLQDLVPANTLYADDSVTLNGSPVGQPDGGTSPLIAGIAISSSDLPAPLPGAGTLTPGESAVITFDLVVAGSATPGTIISNQAVVGSSELPNLLTDGDGNPSTGPEPTLIVVGDGQQLAITKQVSVVGGGAALAGSQLEYLVRVVNVAAVPASNVVITDDLTPLIPALLTYVPNSATMNGATTGVSFNGTTVRADYTAVAPLLQPGQTIALRFLVTIDAGIAIGTPITNTGMVAWNNPLQTASASVSIDVGGMPGVGMLNGSAWHDTDYDVVEAAGETKLQGWIVDLLRNGQPIQSVTIDAAGDYRFASLEPNDLSGDAYALRFRAPDATAASASIGTTRSASFTDGPQTIRDIIVPSGSNLQGLDLPIQPNGTVYGALQRTPVPGASLSMRNTGTGALLPGTCFDDPNQQGQVTRADGFYKFDLNFSDAAACPTGGNYLIEVAAPGSGFVTGESQIIPPQSGAASPAYSVPLCPNDAVPGTTQYCEVQLTAAAPPPNVQGQSPGTNYYMHMMLDASQQPGSSQLFNNHIAIDPTLDSAVGISKTSPMVNVTVGQLVPYEITVFNALAIELADLQVVDTFPSGFHYVEGSARIDGRPTEPDIAGNQLTWNDLEVPAADRSKIVLLLAVGAGVTEGEFVNKAQAIDGVSGVALSGQASATVRVVPDPDFACTDVLGKVFDDANRNGVQDEGEGGLSGVRLVTARGLAANTDAEGRFHITCAIVPNPDRGSNFILKLDDRTLPSGYRMSTRQTQIKRATRGKALRFRYGASIHRVVGLDLADAVFEPGTAEMREQWRSRIGLLLDELEKSPSTLRLTYAADVEDRKLIERRLDAVKQQITEAWAQRDGYELAIETEISWQREAQRERPSARKLGTGLWDALASPFRGGDVIEVDPGTTVERPLPTDVDFAQWAHDPERLDIEAGDTLEQREVVADAAETVKLKNVVPAVQFDSGVANIPSSTIERLRGILSGMKHLQNVRLHLVGHADDQQLSGELAQIYGDNAGLSRERAGEVAEFIQGALSLPPESISFAWMGETEPIASNTTEAGRAQNRRVEVEVWYDELEQKISLEDIVVAEDIDQLKVCRMETVCKMRFREGHARRARVKNLVAPLYLGEESVSVSDDFIRQIDEALRNLRDKQNVTVKFIGFTDDVPLAGRAERIYGTHLSLSKARAHRVALAIKDALELPTAGIASEGRGARQPIASNETDRGRALNRRVEVEFWHDDPLQELPDEPQLCPDAAGAELVTKVYDPPWGRLASLPIEDGEAVIPSDYAEEVRRAMSDVEGKTNVRLRFIGYTGNERLDRRTALVYGDDIGLSTARARRTMEAIKAELGLTDEQAEHEGRGYLHSNDVVNAGFIQGEKSQVAVEVVYDELALLDDYEGVDITPITRELSPQNPLALNLMRITVDGEPIDDPGKSSADIQRCTDVALETADVRFRFDDLASERRLSVTSFPGTVGSDATAIVGVVATEPLALDGTSPEDEPVGESSESETGAAAGAVASSLRFQMYTNYPSFIERSEVRIFDRDQSERSEPVDVIEIGADGMAAWTPPDERFAGPVREMKFVLRAYDAEGRFDETAPQSLWVVHGHAGAVASTTGDVTRASGDVTSAAGSGAATGNAPGASAPLVWSSQQPLLEGYGESGPLLTNIPLGNVGTVDVMGHGVPPNSTVYVAGSPIPVDANGEFVAEAILPPGMHTVEVATLDPEGKGELYLRDLEMKKNDWFYVAIADLTFSGGKTNGPMNDLTGKNAPYDPDSSVDGRIAFFLTGKFADDWKLTAAADTREGPLDEIFSNFLDKSPGALFRRIDPDYHYPTFGDDGTVEELAPTMGRFFVKLEKDESHALWGDFFVEYVGNELALVERGLYGANVHYQTESTTSFGDQRLALDGFVAEPGTVPSREEFRGTGGSLYYLRNQDLSIGSDRVRIELRDKDSGLVSGVVHLKQALDYDIDYFQGRVLLSEPMASTVADELIVRDQGLSGYEAWLVVQYEYTPGFEELDALAAGGAGHYWFQDFLKLGFTANHNDDDYADSNLYAADITVRKTADTWFKVQAARSEGLVSTSFLSEDGGFDFLGTQDLALTRAEANAYRFDATIDAEDFLPDMGGRLSFYAQRQEAGYTAPGMTTFTDTDQIGGVLDIPVIDGLHFLAKADVVREDVGLDTTAAEIDVDYQITDHWNVGAGVRFDRREDDAPVVAATQEVGDRTDVAVQVDYDPQSAWNAYAFGQGTVASTGNREDNMRFGAGGAYQVNEKLGVDGEVSYGDLGVAARLGTNYQRSERTSMYLAYTLQGERGVDGANAREGNLIAGTRTRFGDSASVFLENRYKHARSSTGLTRAVGMTWNPTERWNFGVNLEIGELINQRTNAETKRRAAGASVGFSGQDLLVSSGLEYRFDDAQSPDGSWSDRSTWLLRNTLTYQMNQDWRLLGKLNFSFSDSSEGEFFDGGYREAIFGYAYRPIDNDRLNALVKYTYFYNFPTAGQVGQGNGQPGQFIQESHIAAVDVMYDLTRSWSIGGKYAFRLGRISLEREDDPEFFDNSMHLFVLRTDWRFLKNWETSIEGRTLQMPDLSEGRSGALVTLYRYLGKHLKVGVGYNFTDFSDDLTDLSYDHHGFFFNLVGSL